MLLETGGSQSDLPDVGVASDGSVATVLFSDPSLSGTGYRLTQYQIESELLLRFSPDSNTGTSLNEGSVGRGNNDLDCTQMAQEGVVPISLGSTDRHSNQTTNNIGPVNTGSRDTLAPQSSRTGIGSLEDKRAGLLVRGLSGAAAATCFAATSDSTIV